jgi:Sensors of blue-light using FAD
VYSLTYVSSATNPLSALDLRGLLEICVRNNEKTGVTGMLLYKDGNFMQVIEGEEQRVRHVHHKLARDPRHHGLITLLQGESPKREFPGWSMGFRDLSAGTESLEGYNEFLNLPLTGQEFQSDPSKAQKLLLTFKANM